MKLLTLETRLRINKARINLRNELRSEELTLSTKQKASLFYFYKFIIFLDVLTHKNCFYHIFSAKRGPNTKTVQTCIFKKFFRKEFHI